MSFEWPLALLALAAVPLAIAAYLLLERRRDAEVGEVVNRALLPNVIDRHPRWRRHVPPAILLLAVTAFLLGLARPHAKVSSRAEEATAILAIDTSRSMGATDVSPTRLAAAQASARQFIKELPETYRVAIVAFGTTAQVVAPPTEDREYVSQALAELRVGEGTAIGDALSVATQVATGTPAGQEPPPAKDRPPAVILVLSDGALDGGRVRPDQAIQRAKAAGVPVFTALLGTDDGVVEVKHVGGYVERIRVPPDPNLLKRVAAGTDGKYYATPRPEDLKAVYADLRSRLGHVQKDEEITVAFATGGVGLFLLGGALSLLWFRRLP